MDRDKKKFTLNWLGVPSLKIRGATMVETAFVLPLFLLAVLLFIDFARFFLVYVVLSRAATQGVDTASKMTVEIDTTSTACRTVTGGPACDTYRHLVLADIIDRTVMPLAQSVASTDPTAYVALKPFTLYSEPFYGPTDPSSVHSSNGIQAQPITGFVAFLRPGEAGIRSENGGYRYEHPTRSSTLGWPQDGESWSTVLESHPLAVRIEASVRPFTPFLPMLNVGVTSFAYRTVQRFGTNQVGPHPTWGHTPTPPSPTATSTADSTEAPIVTYTPTNTSTPTETPTPTQTGTPTFTFTAGPSPTPTVTPSASATYTATATATRTYTPTITPTPTRTPTTIPTSSCAVICRQPRACAELIDVCPSQCGTTCSGGGR